MATTATGVREHKQFIGGEWVEAADGGTFEDLDPYTGDVVAHVAAADEEDAGIAIDAAAAALAGWSQTPPVERQRIFLKAADLLEARQMEVVDVLARETGASFGFGMFQTMFVPNL
ncbi:MAG TPA: aldehyde dehydrogenase family protein, partial [Gaiellaceae bacterium]|nr:aldehyde dehydrogenase family protein [Gaiellaceae bacterium]